tara:strand:- start:124 stop:321 length:198 start_codon:yes stop_codon:yes gene_type:complete
VRRTKGKEKKNKIVAKVMSLPIWIKIISKKYNQTEYYYVNYYHVIPKNIIPKATNTMTPIEITVL